MNKQLTKKEIIKRNVIIATFMRGDFSNSNDEDNGIYLKDNLILHHEKCIQW